MSQPDTAAAEVTHHCPPAGTFLTPCCGENPFDLPRTGRMTLDPSLVTCYAPMEDGDVPA